MPQKQPKNELSSESEQLQSSELEGVEPDSKDLEEHEPDGGIYLVRQMPLIHKIEEHLLENSKNNKKMMIKDFCEQSGILIGVMTAILNGNRWVAKCSRTTVEKLSKQLRISVLQIYILSGFIQPEDVVFSSDIDGTLNQIHRQIVKDKKMCFAAPSKETWDTWPLSAKISVCMLYEAYIGKALLRYGSES